MREIAAIAPASTWIIRRANSISRSPSLVSRAERPWRTNRAQPNCCSSRRMCIETADWVLLTRSPARVNEPVSTMAMKERSWSVSSMAIDLDS